MTRSEQDLIAISSCDSQRTLPEAQLVILGTLIVVESSNRNAGLAVIDQRVGHVIPFVVRLIFERIILAVAAKRERRF